MVIEDKQAGTMLLEVILLIALLIILAARAVPEACKFYRQSSLSARCEGRKNSSGTRKNDF